jgi:hypothetical protein
VTVASYAEAAPARFERPEGSFEARAFGNAVHAFADVLARQTAAGTEVDALLREVRGWKARIVAVLRGDGLDPRAVERLAARVIDALENLLTDPVGRWVLNSHEDGVSELALTSWANRRNSVRMDRVFLAGDKPLDEGRDCLWIIDYKTATHGRESVDEFLALERVKYEAQLDSYALIMKDRVAADKLRVGLYYPLLARLVWWAPELTTEDVAR